VRRSRTAAELRPGQSGCVHATRPECDALNAVAESAHGTMACEVQRLTVAGCAGTQDAPDVRLEKSEVVVVKVGGQICVIRDDQRQAQCATLFAAAIVESGNASSAGSAT